MVPSKESLSAVERSSSVSLLNDVVPKCSRLKIISILMISENEMDDKLQ